MHAWKSKCISVVLIVLFTFVLPPAFATTEISEDVHRLSCQILDKQLALNNFVLSFQLFHTKPRRFKSWRVFAYNLSAPLVGMAGQIVLQAVRWGHLNNPREATKAELITTPITFLVANSITLAGVGIERTIDGIQYVRTKHLGFQVKDAKKHFLEADKEITDLLNKRQVLVEKCTDKELEVLRLEGNLLQAIRDGICLEFVHGYSTIKGVKAARLVADTATASAAGTQGFLGGLNAIVAVAKRQPKRAGPVGIGFMISGSIIALGPALVRGARKLTTKNTEEDLRAQLGELKTTNLQQIISICTKFGETCSVCTEEDYQTLKGLEKRLALYQQYGELYKLVREEVSADTFKKQMIKNAFIGGATIAGGTMFSIAGFKHYRQPKKAFLDTAIGGLCVGPAYAYGAFDVVYQKVKEERLERKLAATQTPRVQMELRVQRLQQMQEQVRAF